MTDEQSEKQPLTAADVSKEDLEKEQQEVEKNPPKDLKDWPDGPGKYATFGGREGKEDGSYSEAEEKLGPAEVRHHKDGKVTIGGEEVDDPDQYKGDPIPGGPTDDGTADPGEAVKTREQKREELEEKIGYDPISGDQRKSSGDQVTEQSNSDPDDST